jgi:hypothetical protein
MSATIHYLRPFEREKLAEPAEAQEPAPSVETEAQEAESEPDSRLRFDKRRSARAMPCGRNSKWKKKIGGGVVAREKQPREPE